MQAAPTSASAGASTVVDQPPDAGAPDPDGAYEAMCRSYCQALWETNLYHCVSDGGDGPGCVQRLEDAGISADLCFQIRCVPKLVPPSLCLQQCDAVATMYGPVCGGASVPPAPLCPSPPDDHDRACRSGCAAP